MRAQLCLSVLALGIAGNVDAQTVETFPNTLPSSYAGNSWPFNNTTAAGFRTQFIYDGSQMISQKGPVLIQRIRFIRSSSTSTSTGTLHNVTCSLSTSPVKWNALTTTFANHVGNDAAVIFQGTLQCNATAWYVDIKLTTPFLYDSSQGDLCFDFVRGPAGTNTNSYPGSGGYHRGTATTPFPANRIWGAPTSATGSLDSGTTAQYGYANTCEVTYVPASGLYSSFTATPVEGKSPLTVQFTDTTYSSAGPVQSWAWDFDGDKTIDSTLQNPKHTFTGKGYDVYFSPTLTTTDGTHKPSTYTAPKLIRVNPSTATATNFGVGSTNKPALTPIILPDNSSFYSSTSGIRGFHFVAPTSFVITGFEAPNEYTTTKQTDQVVVCYVLSTPPTGSFTPTSSDVKFFANTKADQTLNAVPPITVKQGEWVGVFGACHTGASTSMRNAYAPGSFQTAVLGKSMTVERLWMNSDPRTNMGIGPVNPATGTLARVLVHVAGNTAVPILNTDGVPALGASPKLDMRAMFTGAQAGLMFLGSGQLPSPVSTPFGNLLVQPPLLVTFPVPNGTGVATLPIPNDSGLTGVELHWQGAAFDLTNGLYGMTNGTKWFLGLSN